MPNSHNHSYTVNDVIIMSSLVPEEYLDYNIDNPKIIEILNTLAGLRAYVEHATTHSTPRNAWQLCEIIASELGCSKTQAYRRFKSIILNPEKTYKTLSLTKIKEYIAIGRLFLEQSQAQISEKEEEVRNAEEDLCSRDSAASF